MSARNVDDVVHVKDAEIQRLAAEIKSLEANARNKDAALVGLTKERAALQDKALAFEAEAASLKDRLRVAEEEKRALAAGKTQLDGQLRKLERQLRADDSQQQLKLTHRTEELENEKAMLLRKLEEMKEEAKTLYRFQEMKTQAIEKLTVKLHEYADLEERYKDLEIKFRALSASAPEHERVIEQLQSLHRQKDDQITRLLQEAREDSSLATLHKEKQVIQAELKRCQEVRAQQDRTIRAQQVRIDKLLQRLETLAGVGSVGSPMKARRPASAGASFMSPSKQIDLADVDIDNVNEDTVMQQIADERVPVELYNRLQEELLRLQSVVREKDSLIMEKDAAIEHLDRKVTIVTKAKATDAKIAAQAYKELEAQLEAIKAEMTTKEVKFKDLEAGLRRELYRAKGAVVPGARKGADANGEAQSPVSAPAPQSAPNTDRSQASFARSTVSSASKAR